MRARYESASSLGVAAGEDGGGGSYADAERRRERCSPVGGSLGGDRDGGDEGRVVEEDPAGFPSVEYRECNPSLRGLFRGTGALGI